MNNLPHAPIAYRINDACRITGLGRNSIYLLLAAGQLDGRKIGGRTVITDASLRGLVDAAPRVGGPAQ